jgi:glycosyltransferase involved in cell wall biosynthesis
VVDNGSVDGSPETVAAARPDADVVRLDHNIGAVARNVGVERAPTPYVAFADDDSWWAPGDLERAADLLDAFPRLAVLAARVLIGPEERVDPFCAELAASPLPREPDLPGPSISGSSPARSSYAGRRSSRSAASTPSSASSARRSGSPSISRRPAGGWPTSTR